MGEVQRFTNCTTGGPVFVDVQDGKIIRLTPLEFDDTDAPSWSIEARGRTFTPPRKALVSPWTIAHRSTVYSPKRILTPLKRVDFDPKGERNIHNRGTSGYEPISWDEAFDLVADEIIRVKREFGPCAIYTQPSSHQMWGNVGYRFSCYQRFLNAVGMTYIEPNPDSWEGWLWGGAHMWGNTHRLGNLEGYDLLEDALKNTEMIVFWSSDPDTTQGGVYAGYESQPRRRWLKDLGVKMVFIDPYFNHTAGMIGDKWLAPRPGTDVPIALAIAFTWLTEGTYDKDYVATKTVGFDVWKDYVLGASDGQPKTPEWAEAESGVLARDIRALAREWASKKTMLAAGGLAGLGGASRCATGGEWPRSMIALITMQGMGKPGINLWSTSYGTPLDETFFFPGYTEGGISGDIGNSAAGKDFVYRMFPRGGAFSLPHRSAEGSVGYRLRTPEIMMHEPHEWYGRGFCGSHIEAQFHKFQYPAPGYSMAQMYYRFGGSFFGTMTDTNKHVRAYREGKVPFVVSQAIWMEGEAKFADVILPACTNFERWDIGEWTLANGYVTHSSQMCNHRIIVLQHKAIEPLGESKSDFEIFRGLAARLGLEGMYTMGRNEYDWVKATFDATDLPTVTTWEDFVKKGYYVVPPRPADRKPTPAHALVRRGSGARHARLGARSLGSRAGQGSTDAVRQGRVRQQQPQAGRGHRSRGPRASRHGTAVHPQLGRPSHDRVAAHVPAATHHAPPALHLPHPQRPQGQLDQRDQGPPRPSPRRPLLLDHASQQQGCRGTRYRDRRPHPGVQRPRIGHSLGPGDGTDGAGRGSLLRVMCGVRPHRGAG